jgi:hypothetical protein
MVNSLNRIFLRSLFILTIKDKRKKDFYLFLGKCLPYSRRSSNIALNKASTLMMNLFGP